MRVRALSIALYTYKAVHNTHITRSNRRGGRRGGRRGLFLYIYYPKNKTERKTCSPNINSKQSASVNSEGGGVGGHDQVRFLYVLFNYFPGRGGAAVALR